MSRSNPNDNSAPNPAVRWFEWNGELGGVRYYDKEGKRNIDLGVNFPFVLLDQLASVRGWHEDSQSGIYANEVRDTRKDVLVVKAFKGGTIAEGLYKDIKDRVNVAGGQFVASCYIAFKQGDGLAIGCLRFKGAALNAWMEFSKTNRLQLYKKAIEITGYAEGKKGSVVFRVPVMTIRDLSTQTDAQAMALDRELQEFLTAHLKRTEGDEPGVEGNHTHAAPIDDAVPMDTPSSITDNVVPFDTPPSMADDIFSI